MSQKKSIRVFLASSNELIEDRNAFELMIERKNKLWAKSERPYIDLQKWEIYSEAVTPTRSQDEYNKVIKTTDILVVLVWKKVGKYTLEEFQFARKQFIQSGKPTILVYQKKSENIETSLEEYLNFLHKEGNEYFHGQYDAFSTLENKFLNELDHYLNKNRILKLSPDDQIRLELLEGLERRYTKRLQKKMDSEINFQLELILEYTKIGTTEEILRDLYVENYETKTSEGFNELFWEFETQLKRMLILGEPGSGKTVLLLQFARRLVEKARINFDYPIPIILNLATWRKEYDSFNAWLEDNLVYAAGEYGASKKYAKELVTKHKLLLLLDGLDEIPENDRDSCLEKLSEYVKVNENSKADIADHPQIIICSRRNEYLQMTKKAQVKATLYIAPLKPEYLIKKLDSLKTDNSSAKVLLNRITDNPTIATKLTNAFDVHLALHLANEFDFSELSRDILLDSYLEKECHKIKGFKIEKVAQYLHHLAYILGTTKKVVTFEFTDIQPEWIFTQYVGSEPSKNYIYFYRLVLAFLRFILIGFIFFSLSLIISSPLVDPKGVIDFTLSIFIGAIAGFIFGIASFITSSTFNTNEIIVKEIRYFSLKEFSRARFSKTFTFQGLKTFLYILSLSVLFGVLAGLMEMNNSYESVDFFEGMKESIFSGFKHIDDGLILSVFPYSLANELIIFCTIFIAIFICYFERNLVKEKIQFSDSWLKNFANTTYAFSLHLAEIIIGLWLIQGFVIGFSYGLYLGPFHKFFDSLFKSIGFGLLISLLLGIISGVFNGFVESFYSVKRSPQVYKPYKRFYSPFLFNFLAFAIPSILISTLIFFLVTGIPDINFGNENFQTYTISIWVILAIALIIGIYNNPILKHFALRAILFSLGKMPLRYRTFLNKVAKTGVMEKDGGQWRFRHQLIQDFFARLPFY